MFTNMLKVVHFVHQEGNWRLLWGGHWDRRLPGQEMDRADPMAGCDTVLNRLGSAGSSLLW